MSAAGNPHFQASSIAAKSTIKERHAKWHTGCCVTEHRSAFDETGNRLERVVLGGPGSSQRAHLRTLIFLASNEACGDLHHLTLCQWLTTRLWVLTVQPGSTRRPSGSSLGSAAIVYRFTSLQT